MGLPMRPNCIHRGSDSLRLNSSRLRLLSQSRSTWLKTRVFMPYAAPKDFTSVTICRCNSASRNKEIRIKIMPSDSCPQHCHLACAIRKFFRRHTHSIQQRGVEIGHRYFIGSGEVVQVSMFEAKLVAAGKMNGIVFVAV